MAADIPLNKLDNPLLSEILCKKFGAIPSRKVISTKFFASFYEETLNYIKNIIKNNKVYFIIDETTDSSGRNVLNILVGVLNGSPCKSMLVAVHFIEKTDSSTVSQVKTVKLA